MAQFDVHRNPGKQQAAIPFVVIIQSRRFDLAHRRVVVPLVLQSLFPTADVRLNPAFDIEGKQVALNPLQIVSIAADRMGAQVGSLKHEGDRIIAAIDLLVSRAWD
jgi:toxin CcdB